MGQIVDRGAARLNEAAALERRVWLDAVAAARAAHRQAEPAG
jgi:hypothetical protein